MSTGVPKLPEILEKIADVVLAHRPKPKTKTAEKRARKAAKGRQSSKPRSSQNEQTKKADPKYQS